MSNLTSKIKHFSKRTYQVWQEKGARVVLAKFFRKLSFKLEPEALISQNQTIFNRSLYDEWCTRNLPRQADLNQMSQTLQIFKYRPIISIIMPVYNTPENYLRQAIESVINQIYPHWELCIADDNSTEPHIKEILTEYAQKNTKIKVTFRQENGHIAKASNTALELATGEFIALLDHDDLLSPDALYQVVLLLNQHPEADMIYSDEDKIDENNNLKDPFFKPDWCPDSFLSRMYTCHLGIYRHSIIKEIGGFRAGYEGSQDYDLVLRLTEKTDKIYHIPKILYHWRIHPQSTATGTGTVKLYAYQAAEKAITEALQRRGEKGKVSGVQDYLGHYIIRYQIDEYKPVSIIIPTKDQHQLLNQCLTSIFTKTLYPNYEIILIDNNSEQPETAELINKWKTKEPEKFKSYRLDIPFNFPKINNYAVTKAKSDYLLFLNNDTEVLTPDWIDALVEQVQRPKIGAAGALLLYENDTIQHAGVIIGIGGVAGHSHRHFPANTPGYLCQVKTINNYLAVTGACLMCRREVFDSIGGFNEDLAVAYNDVDLCLKMIAKGYRNIYLPHVILYHYESKTRGYEDTPEKEARRQKEANILKSRWPQFFQNDPCYNPHLTKDREDYSINL